MAQNGVLGSAATKAVFDALDRGDKLEGALRAGLFKLVNIISARFSEEPGMDNDHRGLLYFDIEAELLEGWPKAVHKIGLGREFKSAGALYGFVRLHVCLAEGVSAYSTATGQRREEDISSFSNVLRLALWDATESTYDK